MVVLTDPHATNVTDRNDRVRSPHVYDFLPGFETGM